jgi:hypothetical protein
LTEKRSRLEIYLDVLRIVSQGEKKPTHIMYKANLSWVPVNDIITTDIEYITFFEHDPEIEARIRAVKRYSMLVTVRR